MDRVEATAAMEKAQNAEMEIEIDQSSEHNFWSGLVPDMSEGGVFVATHRDLPVGTIVRVEVSLPSEKEPVVAEGEVDWTRAYNDGSEVPPGVGVRFVQLTDDARAKILRFIENVRDPIFFAA